MTATIEPTATATSASAFQVRLSSDALRELATVAVACAKIGDSLPALECVRIEWDHDKRELVTVATDRYRLAVATVTEKLDPSLESFTPSWSALVPAKEFVAAVKALPKRRGFANNAPDVYLVVSDGTISVGTVLSTGTQTVIETSQAEFPKWRILLPDVDKFAPIDGFFMAPKILADVAKMPYRRSGTTRLQFTSSTKPVLMSGQGEFVEWTYLAMPSRTTD